MFTGFASENTPAIQVWDFFRAYTGQTSISLTDDCAPIQYIRTGSNATTINLYLPTAPIEGKQIKIINSRYASNSQFITIYSSDANAGGSNRGLYTLGQGQTLDFCYSKNFISFGTASGSSATGWITLNQTSSGSPNSYSVVSGGNSCAATGDSSFVGGGISNTAAALYCSVVGGSTNTVTDNFSSVVGGYSNNVSNTAAGVFCGDTNTAGSSRVVVLGGSTNTASLTNASVLCGYANTANGDHGAVIGGRGGTNRGITGAVTSAASIIPVANGAGFSQTSLLILGAVTTNATATVLRSNTSAATTTNQVILPNNSGYVFQGTCIANVTGGSTTSGWKFEGVIKRGANAASTTLVAAVTPTVIAQDVAAATWVLAITADTTNGGIAVTVTGAAATTIRWVSRIETTEVTF